MKTTLLSRLAGPLLLCFVLLSSLPLSAQFPGCPAIDAGADQTLPCSSTCTNLTATPFHTGAPTTYTVASIPHSPPIAYNEAGGTAISVGTDDIFSNAINLPFNFCFYGTNYTQVTISSNGSIKFGAAMAGQYSNYTNPGNLPNTNPLPQRGDIFGIFHDIDPTVAGSVRWYLLGTSPCRIFVVVYENMGHYSCTNLRSTSMMVLYETTNVIDVYVRQKQTCTGWQQGYGIIGIQNPAGTAGIAAPGRNANPVWTVTTPEAWRFTPNGTPNYTVQWFQGATNIGSGNTINVCPTATTTYTSVITYNRCDGSVITAQDQVTVNLSPLPAATVSPVAETCNNQNNGSVVIDNAPGAGPYTVSISGPVNATVTEPNTAAGNASFTNLPDGTYTYTVTGANSCSASGTFTIAAGPVCCSVTATSLNALCAGAPSGSATANPVGYAPFSYVWTGGQTTQTASNLAAGTYTVTLTDNIGCVATANVTITQPTALAVTGTSTNVSCNGQCNGSINVSASGGTPAYQFSLNGGAYQASGSFTGLCNGSYTVTVRDANNCTSTVNFTITQPNVLSVAAGTITQTTCGSNNGSVTVTASGGTTAYNYRVDGGPAQASATFNGLAAGSHVVQVTDANGCTASVTITVPQAASPVPSITSQSAVSCFGGTNGSVIIGVTGGASPFSYTVGGTTQASNSFTNLAAGSYTATVTDANGCTGTVTFTITSPPQLNFTTTATAASCNGACDGQIAVNASGGTAPYQYSSNNGVTFGTTNPITGLCAGNVSIVVQDANGCTSGANVAITQPAPLTANFTITQPTCNGVCNGQIAVAASGGTPAFQYGLNGGALQAANNFTGVCAGNNTVLVQDSHGCQYTSVQNVTEPPAFGVNVVNIVEANCGFNNGSITVQGNGPNTPYSYSFEGGPFQSSGTFSNLYGGAYQITAMDANGCSETVFFGISDIEMDGIVLVQEDATCFGVPNGTMEVTNVSGAMPITYVLDNSGVVQTTGYFDNLAVGSHVVTIYDGGNCVFTLPFAVSQPAQIQYQNTVVPVACNGGNTGSITFTNVTGGSGDYQYSIDNGATFQPGAIFNGLAAGTYSVQVMDTNDCAVSSTVTITQSPALVPVTSVSDLNCFNDNSGQIQIAVSGGTGAYQYSIDNGAAFSASPTFTGLAAGTYTILVQDAAGCQATTTATVSQPAQLTATYAVTDAQCNGVCDGQIAVTVSGGTAPYLYSPDNGTTVSVNSQLTGLCAGNSTVYVEDDNNCTVTSVQVIGQPTAVTLTAVPTEETCTGSNGQIVLSGNGGTGAYTYSINNGATYGTASTFTGLSAGTYNVAILDANNCPATGSVTVVNEASPLITGVSVVNLNCNAACDGEVVVSVSGGTSPLTYSIGVPQASNTIQNICAGSYTVTVTDDNNCTASQAVTITEPAVLTTTVTPSNLSCFSDFTGEIDFAAAGGTTPYIYSIDNGTSYSPQPSFDNLPAGTYTTIVQDAHNCSITTTVTLSEPAALQIQNIAVTNASCYGVCDGSETATITGGTTPYTYDWSDGSATAAITGLCAGTYNLEVEDANGCTVTGSADVTQPPMLVITSSSFTNTSCNGSCDGTIVVNSAQAVSYSVNNGATFQPSNSFSGLCAQTYTVVVQDAFGCTQSATIAISQPAPLVLSAIPENPLLICYDGFGTLSGYATGGTGPYYYVWNGTDSTQFLNVNLTAPATFSCTVYDQNGCVSNTESANVTVRPQFVPAVNQVYSTCPGQPVTMSGSATGGLPGYTFEWLTPVQHDTLANGSTYTFTPAGNTTVLMVAHDECYAYDTLPVSVQIYDVPQPVITVDKQIGCSPLDANFGFDPSMSGSVASATWAFGDGTGTQGVSGISNSYSEVGCYDVTVQIVTTEGCASQATMNDFVCVVPDPVADFTWSPQPPTTTSSVVTFANLSSGAETYSWNFGSFGSSQQENPVNNFMGVESGTYEICLEATSQYGCVNEICKSIEFEQEMLFFVPNTFTPDGDEFNNTFLPVIPDNLVLDDYSMTIFNRWGEVLFETKDISVGWDGHYRDEMVQEGVYVWTIVARGGSTKKVIKLNGHVNLLK